MKTLEEKIEYLLTHCAQEEAALHAARKEVFETYKRLKVFQSMEEFVKLHKELQTAELRLQGAQLAWASAMEKACKEISREG